MRVIAVEEHMATEAFLRVAHGLDVAPGSPISMPGCGRWTRSDRT
ncbi:MAG: hypothetical protein ABSA93_37620 [Streptosporangiaceae bacterium]|jgi:2,3-dihydroxybenzoate decarboxylase